MQQYFIDEDIQEVIHFNDEQMHHIKNVMRMKEEALVKVVDRKENAALVSIHYDSKRVFGHLVQYLEKESMGIQILLGMALIKKDKWEFCIQKACECGAYEIYPFSSSRSVVKIADEKNEKKKERWQKIASEACEQYKQNHFCEIKEIVSFDELLDVKADLKLIAYENADRIANNLASVCFQHPLVQSILIVIGPEGGFSESEIQKALHKGFTCISLGNRILRAETAAISALSMLNYHYEILGDLYGINKQDIQE